MENLDRVVQHYISVFNHDSSGISPAILNYFRMVIEKHSVEDVLHAIDLSFEELKHKKKPHPTEVIRAVEKNLTGVSIIQEQVKPEKPNSCLENTSGDTPPENKPSAGRDNSLWNIWKGFFENYGIPKSLISKKELEKIPPDLRNFYIATRVCEYVYNTIPPEERKKVDRMVENRLKQINLSQEQDIEEVRQLLRIHFIKKIYGIPY